MSSLTRPTVSAATVPRLLHVLADPNARSADVVDVVADDEGLCRRLLAMANSPYLALTRRVTDVGYAVTLLGRNTVQMVAVAGAAEIFHPRVGMPDVRQHSIETAVAARLLAERLQLDPSDAFTAGLLHDLGESRLWQQDPAAYRWVHRQLRHRGADQVAAEREVMGVDHATIGAERLAAWGVPRDIVAAVAGHHADDAAGLALVVGAAEDVTRRVPLSASRLPRLGVTAAERPGLLGTVLRRTREMSVFLIG